MERFISLKIDNSIIEHSKLIEQYLYNSDFYWLLDCEVENVSLDIKDNMLTFIDGIFYYGIWKWGIWKGGEFRSGEWLGGIFYNGIFNGIWKKGVWKGGEFKGKDLTNKIANIELV